MPARKKNDAPNRNSIRAAARSMTSLPNDACPIAISTPPYAIALTMLTMYDARLPTAKAVDAEVARYQMNHGLGLPPVA